MSDKKVIIIGGGMAGLATGSYLSMNDYDTTIYEMNSVPGGVCTSWKRGGYTVDLCIHWLVGSGPKSSFYDRWNELIDMDDLRFVNHEEFFRVEDGKGNHISIFTDLDRLEREFLQKAPEDREEILEFIGSVRKLASFDMPTSKAQDIANVWDRMKSLWKMLPYMGTFGKYQRMTCREYSEHFKNPLLKKTISMLFGEPEMGVIFGMVALTWFHNKTAGYPVGGSLNFAMKVFEHYRSEGGKIVFDARVKRIITENDRAVGIELANGERHFADYIISAADGHATIFDMLDGKYKDEKLTKFYETTKTFPSLVFIALGIKRDLSDLPRMVVFPIDEPLVVDPQTKHNELNAYIHHHDPTLAPAGGTLVTVMPATYNYAYWENLYKTDKAKYNSEKQRIANDVIDRLEKRFGNIRANVEIVDVSTPVSFNSFSGNWKGSFEGWLITPETGFKHLSHTLPGLKNFYMCGQWVAIGGGLPGVLISGRDTAQIICHEDGKAFKTYPVLSLEGVV